MKQFKNFIIKKSKSVIKLNRPTTDFKQIKIKKIYKFALKDRKSNFKIFK